MIFSPFIRNYTIELIRIILVPDSVSGFALEMRILPFSQNIWPSPFLNLILVSSLAIFGECILNQYFINNGI